MANVKRYECPVDDMCDCKTGECERQRDALGLQSELDRLEKPYEVTLDTDERQGH